MAGINSNFFQSKNLYQELNFENDLVKGQGKDSILKIDIHEAPLNKKDSDINNGITNFQNGKISIEDLTKILQENGVNYTEGKYSRELGFIKFEFNNKTYNLTFTIECETPKINKAKLIKSITEAEIKIIENKIKDFSNKKISLDDLKAFLQENYNIPINITDNRAYFNVASLDENFIKKYAIVISGNNFGKIETEKDIENNNKLIQDLLKEFELGTKSADEVSRELAKLDIKMSISNDKSTTEEKIVVSYLDKTFNAKFNPQNTVNEIIKNFTEGNMAVEEFTPLLTRLGIKYSYKYEKDKAVLEFSYNNKKYKLSCNTEMVTSSTDDKNTKTYDAKVIESIATQQQINNFFDIAVQEGSKVVKYALKSGKTYSEFMLGLVEKLDDSDISLSRNNIPKDGSLTVSKKNTGTAKLLPQLETNTESYIDKNFKNNFKKLFVDKFGPLLKAQGLDDDLINIQFDILYSNTKETILDKIKSGDNSLVNRWSNGLFNNRGNVQVDPIKLAEAFEKEFNAQCDRVVTEMQGAAKLEMSIPEYNLYKEYSASIKEELLDPITNSLEAWKDPNKTEAFLQFVSTSELEFNLDNLYTLLEDFTGQKNEGFDFGLGTICEIILGELLKNITNSEDSNKQLEFLKNNKKSFKELMNTQANSNSNTPVQTINTKASSSNTNSSNTDSTSYKVAVGVASVVDAIGDLLCGVGDIIGDAASTVSGPLGQAGSALISGIVSLVTGGFSELILSTAENRSYSFKNVFEGVMKSMATSFLSVGGSMFWGKAGIKLTNAIVTWTENCYNASKIFIPVDGHKINDEGNVGPRVGGGSYNGAGIFSNNGRDGNNNNFQGIGSFGDISGIGGYKGSNSKGQDAHIYVGSLTSDMYADAGIVFLDAFPGGGFLFYDTISDEYIFSNTRDLQNTEDYCTVR